MAGQVEPGIGKSAGIIGICLLIVGVANAVTGIVLMNNMSGNIHGLWSGGACILAGLLGLLVMWKKSHLVMIFFLILNLMVTIACAVQTFLVWVLFLIYKVLVKDFDDGSCRSVGDDKCLCGGEVKDYSCDIFSTFEAIFLTIVILSGLAAIFALAGAIIGCVGACCARRQNPGAVIVQGQQPPVVYTTAAQPGYPAAYPQGQDAPPEYKDPNV